MNQNHKDRSLASTYILFIVTSFWAYGELTIACEFAQRSRKAGYQPIFLIPPTHKKLIENYQFHYITLLPRNGKINRMLFMDIEHRYHPKLILLADFLNYNFCEKHYGLTPEDLAVFHGRLGTFDDFDWAITGDHMDTYGFKAKKFGEIDVRSYGFSLCPCPVVNPEGTDRKETYHYRLVNQTLPYDYRNTEYWKAKLGLNKNRKLILFTSAAWQESYKQYPDVVQFVEACNQVFRNILKQLAKHHTVLCIGNEGFFSENNEENIIFKQSLPPDQFNQYLLATDLYVSRNFVSTSLARAVLSGIPAVNFENAIRFHKDRPFRPEQLPYKLTDFALEQLTKLQRCYRYRMFPVGWYHFLNPLYKNNPYLKTFVQIEQFDITGALEQMNTILESTHRKEVLLQNINHYSKQLESLPDVSTILKELIHGRMG